MASQCPNFSLFQSLPCEIRLDIWERTAQEVMKSPSMGFSVLWRQNTNPREDPFPSEFLQLDNMYTPEDRAALLSRTRNYRGTRVTWDTDVSRTDSDWHPHRSARQQFGHLAAACREDIPDKVMLWRPVPNTEPQNPEYGSRVLGRFNKSEDIIVLTGPEVTGQPFFPFFGYCPRRDRQVVLVESLATRHGAQTRRCDPLPAEIMERCPELRDIIPACLTMKRVAFVYHQWLDRAAPERVPYYQRLGLQHLWPTNMPALREIYLLDDSIKLLRRVCAPPATTRSFPGYRATFYEVDWKQGNVWNLNSAKGELITVFRSAWELQDKYESVGSPVKVKVLAVVPTLKKLDCCGNHH
jgi:hypothetical protein